MAYDFLPVLFSFERMDDAQQQHCHGWIDARAGEGCAAAARRPPGCSTVAGRRRRLGRRGAGGAHASGEQRLPWQVAGEAGSVHVTAAVVLRLVSKRPWLARCGGK